MSDLPEFLTLAVGLALAMLSGLLLGLGFRPVLDEYVLKRRFLAAQRKGRAEVVEPERYSTGPIPDLMAGIDDTVYKPRREMRDE